MARPIDPEKYASRRSSIVAAASRQFAAHGFERATTASICSEAGISSGTFFHYFPSKLEVLLAVLESGRNDLRTSLAGIERAASGLTAILTYAAVLEAEMSDPAYPVFVAGLAGSESDPRVATALAAEAELVMGFLSRHVANGQRSGEIHSRAPAAQLATWAVWFLDGAAQSAATGKPLLGSRVQEGLRILLTLAH